MFSKKTKIVFQDHSLLHPFRDRWDLQIDFDKSKNKLYLISKTFYNEDNPYIQELGFTLEQAQWIYDNLPDVIRILKEV